MKQLAAKVAQMIIVESDQMKMVENNRGFRQVLQEGCDIRRRHVNRRRLDLGPGSFEAFEKRSQGFPPLAFAHKNHRSRIQAKDQGQVAMPLAQADFVNGNLFEMFQLWRTIAPGQMAILNVFDQVPTDAQTIGDILDGGELGQLKHIPLEGLGVSAAGDRRTQD